MGDITKDFSWSEFERTSYTDLKEKNRIPDDDVRENIRSLVEKVLQPLRDSVREPVIVNSGYRCAEVNRRAGGVPASQHTKGEAADIRCADRDPYAVALGVYALALPYDQMILYNTFVHVSHKREGNQRRQLLYDKDYKGERL